MKNYWLDKIEERKPPQTWVEDDSIRIVYETPTISMLDCDVWKPSQCFSDYLARGVGTFKPKGTFTRSYE